MDAPCNFYTVDNFLIFCKNKSTFFWYSEYDFWFGGIHKLHWCFSMDIFCQCPFIGLFEFFIYTVSEGKAKQPKNAFFVFLGCFWAYVRQPHDHISWAELMAFASINPTNPRTNLWNFHEKFLRICDFEKWPFWIFFPKKNFFLLHSHENQSKFTW